MKTLGVILAGGLSKRMGVDKANLCIANKTLLELAKNKLMETSIDGIVVSRNDNKRSHIADLIKQKGPLSGIHSVAHRFTDYNLFILPVDVPLISSETIENMISIGKKKHTNVVISGHNLPLYFQNNRTSRLALDYTLKFTNQFSVERFNERFALHKIHAVESNEMLNANKPAQWQLASALYPINKNNPISEYTNGTC